MEPAAGTRIGVYEIRSLIGEGGMGRVFRAFDTKLHREVALKFLPESVAGDADRLLRFEREAKTLAALNHPHIAQIYGFESDPASTTTRHALVMELVDGDTLADRIAQGPIAVDEAIEVARQIVDALEAAHDAGIVHRDLKPANIKIREDGTVKVLDFGLAKAATDGALDSRSSVVVTSPAMTTHGVILGTAAYMSPEQARGKGVDHRTDIWAFGCVLYEMLTARRAFDGETVSDTIASILGREPVFDALPASVTPPLRRLLDRCLAKDPRSRLHHIADARFELRDVGEHALEPRTRRRPARPIALIAAGVLAGAALASAVTLLVQRATRVPPATSPLIQLALPVPGLNPAGNGVLMSPNGRFVATLGPNGISTLLSLDGAPSRPIEGMALCWSADSRSLVVLRADGGLLRTEVSGGPGVAFGALPSAVSIGCSWGADGTILIDDERSLYRIAARNGVLTPLSLRDDGGADARRVQPLFLPDGRHFLYWCLTADGQRTVRIAALDSEQTALVTASDAPAAYAQGHLLYQSGATLVAQPFDIAALMLTGEARAITSEAAAGNLGQHAHFSTSDNGLLVYATTNGGMSGEPVWFDRRGNVVGKVPQPAGSEWLNPRVSPDGQRVVANHVDAATGNWDIWMVDLQTGIPTRLTTQPGEDVDAVWSPDGREIAYVSRRGEASGIYRLEIGSGREQRLLQPKARFEVSDTSAPLRTTDWTRDGRFVVYDNGGDIMAVPLAGDSTPIPIAATPGYEFSGRVSPDSHWIAYETFENFDNLVHVQPFPGPGPRTRVSGGTALHPDWTSQRELVWMGFPAGSTSNLRALFSVDLAFSSEGVRASAPRLALPAHVTIAGLIDSRPHWAPSPDGQRFLLRQPAGQPGPAVKVIVNWLEALRASR